MTSRPPFDDEPEFAPGVDQPPSQTTRREFMRWFGASAAMAAIGGCGRTPNEKRFPYNDTPPGLTPGIPQRYATAHVVGGYAIGLLVQSREGRPLKVEGNPEHPASLGATGVLEQGMVLDVYDPRRLDEVTHGVVPRGWEHLARALAGQLDRGQGLRFLLPPTGSPLRRSLIEAIRRELPEAQWCFWEPSHSRASGEALRRIAGRPLQPHYSFANAARVVSLDADFMGQMPFAVRNAREFAARRRVETARAEMNRMYMVEAKPSVTGSLADERLACKSSQVGMVAAEILAELLDGREPTQRSNSEGFAEFARMVAADLSAHSGRSLVIAGDRQPWPVHVIAHAINETLANVGRTVAYTEPVLYEPEDASISVSTLTEQMQRGEVRTLVIAGVDPVYALPPTLGFAEALPRVETSVYWGLYPSATSRRCTWTVPARHPLESWGDAVAYDGTITFQQPLIDPPGDAHTFDELLALFLGRPHVLARELLRELWDERLEALGLGGESVRRPGTGEPDQPDEPETEQVTALDLALQLGLLPNTGPSPVTAPALSGDVLGEALRSVAAAATAPADEIELALYESPCVHDGSYFHNAWLQELPEPITKLTWGNAWMLGPSTARRLGVEDGDVLALSVGQRRARGPVVVVPTHAEDVVSTYFGYGQIYPDRPHFDPIEQAPPPSVGFNAFELRSEIDQYWRTGVGVTATDERVVLARTQDHFDMRDRPLALVSSIEQLHERGELAEHLRGPAARLFLLPQPTTSPQWGMVIDQTVCTGCSACVVACQAENNVAVVGEVGVRQGREMHWLRIDRYYVDDHRVVHQPMLCQHCEYAPCEYVCPVNATVHSPDGLNEMVYNRCIGTRFCSNNCPYKIRRFNWFDYAKPERQTLQHNTEVTVRERGVMEKCTYCVQRIRNAMIDAELADRPVIDGEIQTACQQACPTRAIMFGDLADRNSTVSQWRARPHQYAALHDQGTSPRTRYLVKLVNPGPKTT
jgi:Fe-S-cluster-containing dehydrogenase component